MRKQLFICGLMLCLLASCEGNNVKPVPTKSADGVTDTASPEVTNKETIDMDSMLEKLLSSQINTKKTAEYRYECDGYGELYFEKDDNGDYISVVSVGPEKHNVTFGIKNNIIDLTQKFNNDTSVLLDLSIESYEVQKNDMLWPMSDVTLKINGNGAEENIKIRSCDGVSEKMDGIGRDAILGYSSYILAVSNDGYIIKDENRLYIVQMDIDGIGMNNLTVTHIVILPEDINLTVE